MSLLDLAAEWEAWAAEARRIAADLEPLGAAHMRGQAAAATRLAQALRDHLTQEDT